MIRTISPLNSKVVVERKCDTKDDITAKLQTAKKAFHAHKRTPLSKRIEIASKFLDILAENKDVLVRMLLNVTEFRGRS
jgi:acyl-CoA reductase-like NAD-dependent aldehyde dehydrogenase